MARRYDEPLTMAPGGAGGHDGGPPRSFVWRGRRFTVSTVLSSWQERRAWWREVGDRPASGVPSAQREVWRVEAAPPSGPVGVFDLGRDDDHWLLLRAHD